MEPGLLAKLKTHFKSYGILTPNEIYVSKFKSTVNNLYKIESKVLPSPVIVREFGESPVISPELERRNFLLVGKAGLGPKCLAQTETYRIEEFIPGKVMQRNQTERLAEEIVPALIAFHSISSEAGEPVTLSMIRRWSLMLNTQAQIYMSCIEQPYQGILQEIVDTISDEREILSLMPRTNEYAFLHGDLCYSNIIYGKQKYWLIDYEYSEIGHPSIDLANYIIDGMFENDGTAFTYFPEDEMNPSSQIDFVERYAVAKGIDSEDLWSDVVRAKAVVNYTKMLWAACVFRPNNPEILNHARTRMQLYNRFKNNN